MNILKQQKEIAKNLHPELAKSILAVYNEPKVKEAIETLGKFGLGAYLPHKHDKDDKMIPIDINEFQSEDNLKVSFEKNDNKTNHKDGVVVGWRTNKKNQLDFLFNQYWIGTRCLCPKN